jgi:pimeloyl-ACP methyl ester carboxylesterase
LTFEFSENTIKTGEIDTHYWEIGDGAPLILLHGGGAGADGWGNWNRIMPIYAANGFRTIAIDAVGFGKSGKPSPDVFRYTQQSRQDQVIKFIEVLGLENVSLIGNSMGGLTSLGVIRAIPEKINKMVLMGTGIPKEDSKGFRSLLDYKIGREHMYNIVRSLTNENFEVDEDMVQYRLRNTELPGVMEAYVATMEGIVNMKLDMEEISKIKHKTLIVHGMKDRVVPPEASFELCKTIPNSRLYLIPDCGHWAMMEYPEEFARITTDFILHQ